MQDSNSSSAAQAQPSYAEDRAAIENLMARYLFALDYNDFDSFIETFTEDAEFDYARGTAVGRADILETVKGFKQAIGQLYVDDDGNPAILRHVLAQTVIRVEGDRAWTRAFWYEMANNGPAKTLKMGTFGIYEDELVRLEGEWKFRKRRILNEILEGRQSGPENPVGPMDLIAQGANI